MEKPPDFTEIKFQTFKGFNSYFFHGNLWQQQIFPFFFRYSGESCESLIPIPEKEDFSKFNLGPDLEANSEDEESFDSPKELSTRNPPFDLDLNFVRYRKGKTYEGKRNKH